MYCFMNFLSLSCRSHLTDSSLVSSKNFDPVGRGEEAGGGVVGGSGEWSVMRGRRMEKEKRQFSVSVVVCSLFLF